MADFIVGNPPFLGKGEPMREAFGDEYLEALWDANPEVNKSADFVMFWWNRCAGLLTSKTTRLRRFGLVTTNSITQVFNRRVVERHLGGTAPASVIFAIADHPWTKASKDAAAVRIAMTAAQAGSFNGDVLEVAVEAGLDTDDPQITLRSFKGKINGDLSLGTNTTTAKRLRANTGMSSNGMMLAARGFILSQSEAKRLLELEGDAANKVIHPYLNGGDLVRRTPQRYVIDAHDLAQDDLREKYPHVYGHLLATVHGERAGKRDTAFRESWWLFGRQRPEIRSFRGGIARFIGTTETSKHRIFQFLNADIVPDHMIVAIGTADAFHLGILSSHVHVVWSLASGGTLEDRPRYNKSRTFDPFPFPDPDEKLKAEIADIAEKLDAHRKSVQATHPDITLTEMYNVLEKLRAGTELTDKDDDIKTRALVLVLRDYHDQLDDAVFHAYDWPRDLTDEQILERPVTLNKERAAEEATGKVRWLRPDYQIPRFGSAAQKAERKELDLVAPEEKGKPSFPIDELRRTSAIYKVLATATAPLSAADIAGRFRKGKSVEREIGLTLKAYVRFGDLVTDDGGRTFHLSRAA